jgi:hypothetical protein
MASMPDEPGASFVTTSGEGSFTVLGPEGAQGPAQVTVKVELGPGGEKIGRG